MCELSFKVAARADTESYAKTSIAAYQAHG